MKTKFWAERTRNGVHEVVLGIDARDSADALRQAFPDSEVREAHAAAVCEPDTAMTLACTLAYAS